MSPVADLSGLKVGDRVTYNARTGTDYAISVQVEPAGESDG